MPVFLFTDIEGSTQLWEAFGPDMGRALDHHDKVIHDSIERFGGTVVKHTGDGLFAVFHGGKPLHCAIDIQQRILSETWAPLSQFKIRIALHQGEAEKRGGDYFGSAVNRTARLLNAAQGGQILLSAELLASHDLPADATIADYGEHLLKDLGQPQHILGLLPSGREATVPSRLRSLSAHSHNLVPQATPFIGRESDLAEVLARIDDPDCRLLSIVGPGGIGKTRLALQAAAERIESFAHGVFQVALASLSDSTLLHSNIADALQLPLSGEQPPDEQLGSYLQDKNILLLLDNFEHLLSAAPSLVELLQQSPQLKLLVTSRERLNLHSEWLYEVKGLKLPPIHPHFDPLGYGSVHLFVETARRLVADFALDRTNAEAVARICHLVEGVPLGIELAAAWVRALSCERIAAEIARSRDFLATTARDVPRRHQSLRAVFVHSWQLLSPNERTTLKRLAIFQGDFTADAAQNVASCDLHTLLSLVDKSLLRQSASDQFQLLDTMRQYSAERLTESGGELKRTERRHYLYFLGRLAALETDLIGSNQKQALRAMESDIEDLRTAWNTAAKRGDLKTLAKASMALFHLYEIRSAYQEGLRAFSFATKAAQDDSHCPDEWMATLLARRGWFSYRLGRYDEAEEDLEESLVMFERLELPNEKAFALYNLGILAYQLGDYERARSRLLESLSLRRVGMNEWGIARSLSILGIIARDQGEQNAARARLRASLVLHKKVGDHRGVSRCLNVLGLLERDLGNRLEARKLLQESLAVSRDIHERRGIGFALNLLGVIAHEEGEFERALSLHTESLKIRERIGDMRGVAFALNDLGNATLAMDRLEEAAAHYGRALDIAIRIRAVPVALYILAGVADLELRNGRPAKALELALLVQGHPGSFEMASEKAERIAAAATELLTDDDIEAVHNQVDVHDFEATVAELQGAASILLD